MDFRKERIEKICSDLKGLIIKQRLDITKWLIKEGTYYRPEEADNSRLPFSSFDSDKDFWLGNDRHYWFRTSIKVPESFKGKTLWLTLSTQKTFWDAVNPQFLVFINGNVIQGADVNHREIKICDNAVPQTEYTIDLQAYTGRDSDVSVGSTKRLELYGSLVEVDPLINSLYYDLLVPSQIISWLQKDNSSRIKLEVALEKVINILDLRKPYSNEFYSSIDQAKELIRREIYEKLAGYEDVLATCIGHTHIDIAWWWTVEQTKEKAVRSFSSMLSLMDEYPDFKFMSSQPQLYKFVKERYPEVYEKIKSKIKSGNWEAEGGMWLEADCNVTSGESLVRQILHGKKFFKEEFNIDSKVVWLPDVFGYSGALPQIMQKCGIQYFMTTKIAWNQYNQFPYDTFWWQGIDGTKIFTHLITTQNANQSKDSFFTTYNGLLDAVSLIRSYERYQQKELNNDMLISYGYGDGGGGTTREMIEIGKRMQKGIIGSPKVRFESSTVYFDQLYNKLKSNPKLPKWAGELYLEYHRGTYTSMARNKRSNRKCELLWQDVEFFSIWAKELGVSYPKEEIYKSWENILLNQFHDILPGSSIKEVYDVTKLEYEALESNAKNIIQEKVNFIADNLAGRPNDIVFFNTLSFNRSDIAVLDWEVDGLIDENNNPIKLQKTSDNKTILFLESIKPKGAKVCSIAPYASFGKSFTINSNSIETPFYIIEFDDRLQFTRIYDKEASREVLKENCIGNVLHAYEDKPMYYDNWDIDIYYTEKSWIIDNVLSSEWIEVGPVRATLLVKRQFLDSIINQKIHFYADKKPIEFETYVDWKQFNVLLKAEFDVDINTTEATFDIQFGNIKRSTHKNTSWDKARFEVCGHKWVDISEGDYGFSLMNDSKYGHSVNEGKIGLTLLKSGTCPNPDTDQEEHNFTYAIYPHFGDVSTSNTHELALMLNVPIYSAKKNNLRETYLTNSLASVNADNVIIETIKESEDGSGVIIRLYEYKNRRTNVEFTWYKDVTQILECDLLENKLNILSENCDRAKFVMKPYEIKTLKLIY